MPLSSCASTFQIELQFQKCLQFCVLKLDSADIIIMSISLNTSSSILTALCSCGERGKLPVGALLAHKSQFIALVALHSYDLACTQ